MTLSHLKKGYVYHIRTYIFMNKERNPNMAAEGGMPHTIQNILEVAQYGGADGDFYRILAPLQITIEYCSGSAPEDHYNILMASPSDHWLRSETMDGWFHAFNTRSMHRHDYFELLIVLEGEMIQRIEGKDYVYRAGTCCLINRNIMHIERFTGPAKICFVGVSAGLIQELLAETARLYFPNEGKLRANLVLAFMQANSSSEIIKEYMDLFPIARNQTSAHALHGLTEKLTQELISPVPGSTYLVKGILCELFAYLESDFYATPVKLNTSSDHLLFLRIQRILEDTNGRISRSELAELLHYNGSYLNNVVHRHTGMCLFDYGMTFCFKKVEKLLTETALPVNEIAAQMDFTNRTHFYKLFRSKYGMTPQQFRARKQ